MNPLEKKNMDVNTPDLPLALAEADRAMKLFDDIVYRSYLQKLGNAVTVPLSQARRVVRWYKLDKIVYPNGVFVPDKLAMCYKALHHVAEMVAMLIQKHPDGTIDVLLGTRDKQGNDFISAEVLLSSLKGYLPGIRLEESGEVDISAGYRDSVPSVSCVSGVASFVDDKKERFIQGIDNLLNGTKSIRSFTALILADNVSAAMATEMVHAYEELHQQLSPLAQIQVSKTATENKSVNLSLSQGFFDSLTKNTSRTVTEGKTTGKNTTENDGLSINLLIASYNEGSSTQEVNQKQESKADTEGEAKTEGKNINLSLGNTYGITNGETLTMTIENQYIKNTLDTIDRQTDRIRKALPRGLWSAATYFISKDNTTSKKLASIYAGTIIGEHSDTQAMGYNHWSKGSTEAANMMDSLRAMRHPQFNFDGQIRLDAGTLVDSYELSIHLSLPQTSVQGILVREEQSFGRNVMPDHELTQENSIRLGHIHHLGETYPEEVRLDINRLTQHALVTGTTGSGKSNTLYHLLEQLSAHDIKFMVIEPAKGEYKNVIATHPSIGQVKVYGTNPRMNDLLCFNPFSFPEDVMVEEHIEALASVFNACWPMYAAMPQVMKQSITNAYRNCGWDIRRSVSRTGIYPKVEDVLDALKEYINASEYSADSKSDYKGALETRLQSLREGILGRMLEGEPLGDGQLFNENVIIDLSRLQSTETKSLLMGLLVMKMNEYRQTEGKGMNLPLRHVTVMEEAHHLLKRTSTVQQAESSNIVGLAVERIATSMSEMRTYGQGFIIVDQSPGMLDTSAVRNTNTKIVMSLPDKDDVETAGKSINLTPAQMTEITRLKTGEALVYQTGWEETVKCRIDYCDTSVCTRWSYEVPEGDDESQEAAAREVYRTLYRFYTGLAEPGEKAELLQNLKLMRVAGSKLCRLTDLLENVEEISPDVCAETMTALVGTGLCRKAQHQSDIRRMNASLREGLSSLEGLSASPYMNTFMNMYMYGCSLMSKEPFFQEWLSKTYKMM